PAASAAWRAGSDDWAAENASSASASLTLASARVRFTMPSRVSSRALAGGVLARLQDRKSTRLNSSHGSISYAVFCLKKKTYTVRKNVREKKTRYTHSKLMGKPTTDRWQRDNQG